MKELIQQIIDLLKKRVKENLEIINRNQSKLNELLTQPFSSERTYKIESNYSANKALLSQNNDMIGLQLSLASFLEKHKDVLNDRDEKGSVEPDIALYLDDDEIFQLTIKGKLGFGKNHPRFSDETFFNRLLSYYASVEAYEKCNALLKVKNRLNQI